MEHTWRAHEVRPAPRCTAERSGPRRAPGPHGTPLTSASSAGPDYDANGLIWPHPSGKPSSENALSLRAKKDGLGCTPHGFRSSFKGWATSQGDWAWETIEISLAHRVGNSVAQAYFRDDLLEQRRPLMQEWADYVWGIRPF